MKKLLSFKSAALCMVAMAAAFSSCSSDDDTVNVNVDSEVAKSGVAAVVYDGIYDVNVTSNGKWTASVPEDCNWLRVLDTEGTGNGKLQLLVDGNYTGIDRKTKVSLTTDDETKTFVVSQTAGDGANDAAHIMLAGSKNLGFGFDLVRYYNSDGDKDISNYVDGAVNMLNTQGIKDLMATDTKYYTLATTTPAASVGYDNVSTDTIVSKKDSLGVSLDIKVGYGLMKFGISGKYSGKETFKGAAVKLRTGANYPTLTASVNYKDLAVAYSGNDNKLCKGVYSLGFSRALDELEEVYNSGDSAEMSEAIEDFISEYNTGVIVGVKLGGMLALDAELDSAYIDENMGLTQAKISAEVKTGLFSLKGDAEASYTNAAITHMLNARYKLSILGGSQATMTSITDALRSNTLGTDLVDKIHAWEESITVADDAHLSSGTNNSEMIDCTVVSIWSLIPNRKVRNIVRKYVLEKYPDTKFAKYAK